MTGNVTVPRRKGQRTISAFSTESPISKNADLQYLAVTILQDADQMS